MAIAGIFGASFESILPMTNTLTMTAVQASYNLVYGISGLSGGKVLTLPPVSAMAASQNLTLWVMNDSASGGTITLAAASGDTLVGVTTAAVATGRILKHDGIKTWFSF